MSREGLQVAWETFLFLVLPWMAEWLESTAELALTGGGGKCMSPWKMMEESSRVSSLEAHDD